MKDDNELFNPEYEALFRVSYGIYLHRQTEAMKTGTLHESKKAAYRLMKVHKSLTKFMKDMSVKMVPALALVHDKIKKEEERKATGTSSDDQGATRTSSDDQRAKIRVSGDSITLGPALLAALLSGVFSVDRQPANPDPPAASNGTGPPATGPNPQE